MRATTIPTYVNTFVYLFVAIFATIVSYPLFKIIRALASGDTYLSAIMFICVWLLLFTITYMGTIWTLQNKEVKW